MRRTNREIAELLQKIATALEIKGEQFFRIRAYRDAAENIDHFSGSVYEFWKESTLEDVPGIGSSIAEYLAEYFKSGSSKHFDSILKDIPNVIFELDKVPGLGGKIALKLVKHLNVKSLEDVLENAKIGKIAEIKGLGKKSEEKIKVGVENYLAKANNTERMLLKEADSIIDSFIKNIPPNQVISTILPVGSVRRRVPTVGDFDFAVETESPAEVENIFGKHPDILEIEGKGEFKMTLKHREGYRIDILMQPKDTFSSLLQHFTGSKAHNILLRKRANNIGLSLSEHGVKKLKGKKDEMVSVATEEVLYEMIGLQYIPPELREGEDEIEYAERSEIPLLITRDDIKGDIHIHSNFNVEPSHDLGKNSIEEIAQHARNMGYSYVGIADHNPAIGTHTEDEILAIVKKRKEHIEQINTSIDYIEVKNCLEIDILSDGKIALPDKAFEDVTFVIAGIHSGHSQPKEKIMKRLIAAITHPQVHMISHPTGRLINERESYEADWDVIFELCANHHTILEINSAPQRLDLPDFLVRQAKEKGVKFCVDTDSHSIESLSQINYGLDVARRGWCTKDEIANSWSWEKLVDYLREGGKKI